MHRITHLQAFSDKGVPVPQKHPYAYLRGLTLLMMSVGLLLGAMALYYLELRLVATTGESLAFAAANIADKLDLILYERSRDVQKAAKALRQHNITSLNEYLVWMKRTDPSYRWLAVTDAKGRIVAATDPTGIGKDMNRKPWFQAVRQGKEVDAQDVQIYQETGGIPAIAFTAPIKGDRNEFLGALTTRVGLTSLEDIFTTTKEVLVRLGASPRLEYQFLSRNGDIIVDSALRQEGKLNLKQTGLPSALLADSGQSGYVEETHSRRRVLVVTGYAQTKGYGDFKGFHWAVLVRMDRSAILTPVRSVLWKLGVIGLIICLPLFSILLWTTGRVRREWTRTQESEEWLSTTLMSISDAVIATDKDGRIVSMNRVAESLVRPQTEAIGQPLPEIIRIVGKEKHTPLFGLVEKIIHEGVIVGASDNTFLVSKDGSEIPIEYSGAPIRNPHGDILGIILIFRDITPRRTAEEALHQSQEELRQAQKMEAIGKLAGGVAHDFNNYLTVIMGYSSLLLQSQSDGMHRGHAEAIVKAGEGATLVTQQLLAFSRKQIRLPQVIDLNAVVTTLAPLLRRIIGEDIELIVVPLSISGFVKADAGQIEQIIMNLVVNARDAMLQGGKLTITITNDVDGTKHRSGDTPCVLLTVSDTGCGMDSETQAHLFEPFFTTKEEGKGTGLGLSTVYGIVNQSGGSIALSSEVGKGTTFKIYLPRVEEGVVSTVEPEQNMISHPQRSETVLVVEDEDAVRAMTMEILESDGYKVLQACHGKEAFQVCGKYEGPIHLMVTDVVMPGMNGRELAERLTGSRPEMKVLYVSGYTDDAIFRDGVLQAGMPFLPKPFKLETLLNSVRGVLEQ
jgi:two-component system, cell cycle sensor histidine kinase and response regulator CckA